MLSVVILGTGNVARFLFDTLQKKEGIRLNQVVGRSTRALRYFQKEVATTTDFSEMIPADIHLIAVSDDAISSVAQNLKGISGLLAHTSGSVPLTDLPNTVRRGVFYPLQTFSQNQNLDHSQVPLCIEAEHGDDVVVLKRLGRAISGQVVEIDSAQRKYLHLSAVLVNNFTNHLYHLAHEVCKEENLPFQLLKPLIWETVKKIDYISPFEAQTGPAKRNDMGTMEKHIELLKTQNLKNIYQQLSTSIRDTYGEEL